MLKKFPNPVMIICGQYKTQVSQSTFGFLIMSENKYTFRNVSFYYCMPFWSLALKSKISFPNKTTTKFLSLFLPIYKTYNEIDSRSGKTSALVHNDK